MAAPPAAGVRRAVGRGPGRLPTNGAFAMAARHHWRSRLQIERPEKAFVTRLKIWDAPRIARLDAGSAESGSATEEDGEFTAS